MIRESGVMPSEFSPRWNKKISDGFDKRSMVTGKQSTSTARDEAIMFEAWVESSTD
jgi:hypothetical protein